MFKYNSISDNMQFMLAAHKETFKILYNVKLMLSYRDGNLLALPQLCFINTFAF